MTSSRIVHPSVATLVLALLFAVPENTRANVTYRPGLMQAQILSGSSNGFATEANGVPNLASNLIAIAQSDDKVSVERASGVLMDGSSSTANPVTGTSFSWPEKYGVFAYEGEIYVTADTTYRFYGQFDDGEALVVDGVTAVNQGANSGYNNAPAVRNPYTAASTGWVPFNAWIWDWAGGKAPHTSLYALEWNADNIDSDFGNSAKWSQFRDDGTMSFLRTDTGETFTTIHSVEQSGDNLVLNVSFTNVPSSSTLVAYFGNNDRGTSSAGWDSSVSLGTIAAGNTAAAPFTVAGAATANYLRLCLSNPTKASGDDALATVFEEWTKPVDRNPAPAVSLSLSSISYTNAVYESQISSFGIGSTFCDLVLEISRNASFDPVDITVSTSGVDSASVVFPISGLITNTVYYARVVAMNDQQKSGASSILSNTTLTPGAPECQVESVVSGLTTFSVTGKATAFGAGATSATMRLEAFADAGFATPAGVSEEVPVALGGSATIGISGLSPDTEYRLRLRIVNNWGLETSTNLLPTATLDAPIVASGIRRTFASDISTVDVFFDVTAVFDGATGTATLYCDESDEPTTNRGERAVSAPGTLAWEAIPFGGNAYHAKVVLVSEANGVVYTQTWAAVVDHSFKRFRPVKFDMDPNCVDVDEPGKPIWHPEYAFDGDYSTGASAETGCSVIGKLAEMLDVPQDQEVYVTRIDVTLDGNSRYSLYTSEDGTTWELVEGATNVTHSGTASYAISTVANFVKCTFESSSGGPKSLLEVEAWGFVKEKPRVVSRWEIASFHNEDGSPMTADGGGGNNGSWGGTSPKKRMFDDNFTSYQMWPKAGKNGYVMVDFTKNTGSGTDLQEYFVTELWVGADGTKKFTLQYSEDGANWQDVDGAVGITCEGIGKYTVCKTVKAVRYVWTDDSYGNFADEYLAEFQVWGINPNDAPCDHPKYSEWEIGAVPATCTEMARDQRKCLVCGAKFARISAVSSPLGHDYVTTLDRPGHFSQRKDFLDHRRYGAGSITCSRCTFRLDFPSALDLVTNRVDGVRVCGEKSEGIVRFTDLSVSSENHPEWGPGKKKLIDEVWNVSQEWPYWTTVSTNAQYADFEFGTTIDLTEVEISVYNHGYRFDFCSVDDDEETETTFCSISISHEEATEAKLETIEVDVPGTGRTKEIPVQKMATDDYQRVRIPFFETPINHLRIRIVDEEPADLWGSKGIRVIEIHPWGTVRGASDYPSAKTTLMILR